MTTYTLPRAALRALMHFVDPTESRKHLRGIHCRVDSAGQGRLSATDGLHLGVIKFDAEPDPLDFTPCEVVIPADVVKQIKADRKLEIAIFLGSPDRPGEQWTLRHGSSTVAFDPIDDKFPDVDRIIPRQPLSNEPAQFNIDLLASFAKAAKEMTASKMPQIRIGWNGSGVSVVRFLSCPEFVGLVMPLRTDGDDPVTVPDWALAKPPIPAAAAV